MKTIEVVAAIIKDNNKILATRRGYGEFIDKWEFPGGKIETNETKEDALIREIQEELCVSILPEKFLLTINYDYPEFHLIMHCFLSKITEGSITLIEHSDAKWLETSQLDELDWLPADLVIIEFLKSKYIS